MAIVYTQGAIWIIYKECLRMRLEEKRNKKQARQAYDDHKTARGEASSWIRKEKNNEIR